MVLLCVGYGCSEGRGRRVAGGTRGQWPRTGEGLQVEVPGMSRGGDLLAAFSCQASCGSGHSPRSTTVLQPSHRSPPRLIVSLTGFPSVCAERRGCQCIQRCPSTRRRRPVRDARYAAKWPRYVRADGSDARLLHDVVCAVRFPFAGSARLAWHTARWSPIAIKHVGCVRQAMKPVWARSSLLQLALAAPLQLRRCPLL